MLLLVGVAPERAYAVEARVGAAGREAVPAVAVDQPALVEGVEAEDAVAVAGLWAAPCRARQRRTVHWMPRELCVAVRNCLEELHQPRREVALAISMQLANECDRLCAATWKSFISPAARLRLRTWKNCPSTTIAPTLTTCEAGGAQSACN